MYFSSVLVAFILSGSAVVPVTFACDPKIIKALSEIPECYDNGTPPTIQYQSTDRATYVVMTPNILTYFTYCLTIYEEVPDNFLTLHLFRNSSGLTLRWNHFLDGTNILETDNFGVEHRVYTIHNRDGVYSFYRCTPNLGINVVAVAVSCDLVDDPTAQEVVERAKKCFKQLNMKYESLTPCDCVA